MTFSAPHKYLHRLRILSMRTRHEVSKTLNPPYLKSLMSKDTFSLLNSSITVLVELHRKSISFSKNSKFEARLKMVIENSGETDISNLAIDFVTPDGVAIVDPGVQLGTMRRHIRLPRLNSRVSKKYKLGLKPSANFQSGILKINIAESSFESTVPQCEVRIGLTAS